MHAQKNKTICMPFVGDSVGGSHISAITFLQAAKSEKTKFIVIVHQFGKLTDYLKKKEIEFELLKLPTFVGRHKNILYQVASVFRVTPKLVWFLWKRKIDIVHTHDVRMHLTWGLAAKLTGAIHVWHQRTIWSSSRLSSLFSQWSSYIIAISKVVQNSLSESVSRKSGIIWNPVILDVNERQVNKVKEKLLSKMGCSSSKFICIVGNLRAVKQPLFFIDVAIHMLTYSNEKLTFLIIGEDKENYVPKMEQKIANAGLIENFLFMGFRDDANEIIAASDLLLATSKADAFGRTLVEAMMCGTPVVATNAGGHKEIIENGLTGCLVNKNDVKKMAEAGLTILNEDEKRVLMIKAAKKSAEKFSPNVHAEKVMQLYENLMSH